MVILQAALRCAVSADIQLRRKYGLVIGIMVRDGQTLNVSVGVKHCWWAEIEQYLEF
jgi:hypothetical protein